MNESDQMRNKREIYDTNLPGRTIAVFLYLHDRADREGKCFPSHKRIAMDLSISVSTVKRALNDLEKEGYIKQRNRFRDTGGQSSNLYFIL